MPFDYGALTVWLLVGFLQGMTVAVLLFRRYYLEERLSDLFLALLLLFSAFHIAHYMLAYGGWYDTHDAYSSFMFYFPFHNFLIIAPLIYFYFRSLTNFEFKFERKHFPHFILGGINLLLYLVIYFGEYVIGHMIMDQELPLHYHTKGIWADINQGPIQTVVSVLAFLVSVYYLSQTLKAYSAYRKYIKNNFSDIDPIRFRWVRNLLYFVFIGMIFYWIIDLVDTFIVSLTYRQYWFSYLGFSIMIYFLGIFGYANRTSLPIQRKLQFEPEKKTVEEEKEEEEQIDLNPQKTNIKNLVEGEELYLNPDITLVELAERLKMGSHELSKILNVGFEKNFNDFINSYRVMAVQEKIKNKETEQFTMLSLAMDAGFNSKATFNRAFKKFAGMSPTEYQRKLAS